MQITSEYIPSKTGLEFHKDKESFIRGVLGVPGCYDHETEVLTPDGWIKGCEWSGQKIMCYDKDTRKGFFADVEFVKIPMAKGEKFNYFKSRSLDMMLSDEHTVLYSVKFNKDKYRTIKASDMAEAHHRLRDGFDGRIPVAFDGEVDTGSELPYSDMVIRFLVALSAGGSIPKRDRQVVFTLRKQRKIDRLLWILSELEYPFAISEYDREGKIEVGIRVTPPSHLRFKGLHNLRGYSQHQARVILDEIKYWDGYLTDYGKVGDETTIFSTSKFEEKEFACELAAICGFRAYVKTCKIYGNRKRSWEVFFVDNNIATMRNSTKNEVLKVASTDGYKYCFTTPTGFFLARRNDRTFITGNSGKSVMMIQELLWIGYNQAPDQYGVRNARFAIIRASYPNLRETTIKTYQQWIPPLIAPVKQTAPMSSVFRIGLPDGTTTNFEFIFLAVENQQDAEKLKSLELTAAFMNEASECDESVLDMLQTRVGRYPSLKEGGCTYSCIIFDSNPPSDSHWIAQLDRRIQRGEYDGARIFHQPAPLIPVYSKSGEIVDYKDNPEAENLQFLNQKPGDYTLEERKQFGYDYYRRQIPGKSQHWINVFILGQYGSSFDGKPVYQAHWTEEVVSTHSLVARTGEPVLLGIDTTGLNPAVVMGQLYMGMLQVQHELLALDMPFKTFVRDILRPFLAQHYPNSQVIAYCDPANPRDSMRGETPIQLLRQYDIMAQSAPTNKFKPRLDSVVSFLQRREGLLIDFHCEKLVDGFRGGYHYRPVNVSGIGQTYSSEPSKNEYSHIHDAFQYLCSGIRQGSAEGTVARPRKVKSKRVYG